MRSSTPFTVEFGLYAVILLVAIVVRLYNLGGPPLTDAEAAQALTAWRLVSPGAARAGAEDPPTPGAHVSPLLASLTTLAFALLGAHDATARLASAIAGAFLALTPALYRRWLGRPAALICAGILALAPTAVAASRSGDGTTLAALALVAMVGCVLQRQEGRDLRWLVAAAIALGLGLSVGQRWWAGAFVAALTLALVRVLAGGRSPAIFEDVPMRRSVIFAAGGLAFLLGATLFGLYRPGISAAGNGLLAWLRGFAPASNTRSALLVPAILSVYEPFVLALGVGALAQWLIRRRTGMRSPGRADSWRLVAMYAAFIALLYGIAYPGRQASDSLWVTLALAPLAAAFLMDVFSGEWAPDEPSMAAVLAGIILVLLTFGGLSLGGYAESVRANPTAPQTLRLSLAATALALTVLLTALVGLGWSARAAVRGLTAGMGIALALGSLAAGWALTQVRAADARELWRSAVTPEAARRLASTLEEVSNRAVGAAHDIEITVQASLDSALAWELREFGRIRYVNELGDEVVSPVVVAPEAASGPPVLDSAYVGQAFAIREWSRPDMLTPAEWAGWWAYRRAPLERERVILWVRQDIQLLEAR